MRNVLHILFAIILVAAGIGIVRPHTMRLVRESWEAVARDQRKTLLISHELVELDQPGDYVVFLEGPSGDSLWDQSDETWIQLFDCQTQRPLPMTSQGLDYAYDLDERHAQALAKVSVPGAGTYELDLGSMDSDDFVSREYRIALSPVKVVDRQSWRARLWLAAGIATGTLMGIVAIAMLAKR